MPGPLSATVIPLPSTVIAILGATPAASQASKPLSSSSLSATRGQSLRSWPVCAVSSFSLQKSSRRLVLNVVRVSFGPCASFA